MSYDNVCPFCDSSDTVVMSYAKDVKLGRRKIRIGGLRKLHCEACGSDSVPGGLHDANLALINEAAEGNRGAVTVGVLRTFRESWSLSQKDASCLFGAGKSSFAKWESGQAKLSTPSALLIQIATKFPFVVPYLAKLSGTTLSDGCEAWSRCASTFRSSYDVFVPKSPKRIFVPPTRDWGKSYAVNDACILEAA